jgi:ribosomal protein L5
MSKKEKLSTNSFPLVPSVTAAASIYAPQFQFHYENSLRYDLAEKLGLGLVTNSQKTPKIEKIVLSASVSFKPQQVRGLAATSAASLRTKHSTAKVSGKSRGLEKGMLPNFGHGLEDCTLEVRKALILLSGQALDSKLFRVGRPHLGIRKGRLAAYQVTLRNQSMYFFLERLLTEVIPTVSKIDPATLTTSAASLSSRYQRTSTKVANLQPGKFERVPLTNSWLNDGSHTKKVFESFFDGNGNFQLGIPDFYLFREIEQNIEFTKLNGLNVTIVTSAKTDREARLLLSGFQAPFAD